jgi:Bacterial type III secretion protein (HrpB7)
VITLTTVNLFSAARKRRLDRLQAELALRKAETAKAVAVAQQAHRQLNERAAATAHGSAQMAALMGANAVRPEEVVMQGHVLSALQALEIQAQGHLTQALELAQQARDNEDAVLMQVNRIEQQLKKLAEHRERLLREQDARQQDLQDEESEEAAQVRSLGLRRRLSQKAHAQAAAGCA